MLLLVVHVNNWYQQDEIASIVTITTIWNLRSLWISLHLLHLSKSRLPFCSYLPAYQNLASKLIKLIKQVYLKLPVAIFILSPLPDRSTVFYHVPRKLKNQKWKPIHPIFLWRIHNSLPTLVFWTNMDNEVLEAS